tara:strand:+ start:39 stop:1838 length:1800 start_codon:yes stop_codon:yes gene_type:complete
MDEFGSPLTGGIRAVRRNLSSSFFRAPQTSQPDTITTDLLQEQSLKLTTVSGQLQNISRQISVLDFNIKSVRENIALGDQLERQREAEKQKRERILAEQGLREGKESALEQKMQSALVFPLQRIGVKAQGILEQVGKYLLTLAGGWLTLTGLDLLQSMAEGNIDKINKLKTKFLVGLTTILGSLTAISIGIKKTLAILSVFGGNVARIAFGGLFKSSLFGVRVLLAGLVRKAAGLGGIFGGGPLGALAELAADIAIVRIFGGGGGKVKNLISAGKGFSQIRPDSITRRGFKPSRTPVTIGKGDNFANKTFKKIKKVFNKPQVTGDILQTQQTQQPQAQPRNKLGNNVGNDVGAKLRRTYPRGFKYKINNPSFLERARSGAVGLFNRGKNLVDDGVKAIGSSGIVTKAKNLTKGLPKLGVGKLLGKVLGPFITFFTELLSEDGGLMSALAATGGFMAGAKVGAIAGGAIGALFGGVGAGPGAFIGALIGGFAGETVMKNLSKKIMSALGIKDVKIFGKEDENSSDSNNIEAVKNNNLDAANKISSFTEDNVEVIVADNTNNENSGGAAVSTSDEGYLPDIRFDRQNPHSLSTSSLLGIGD